MSGWVVLLHLKQLSEHEDQHLWLEGQTGDRLKIKGFGFRVTVRREPMGHEGVTSAVVKLHLEIWCAPYFLHTPLPIACTYRAYTLNKQALKALYLPDSNSNTD